MSRWIPLLQAMLACFIGAPAGPCQPAAGPPPFPLQFDFAESTQRWANQSPIDEHSLSEWAKDCGRTGGGIHMKGSGGSPDQMRVWRKLIPNPPAGRRLHVTAWAKGAGVENLVALALQAHAPASPRLAGFESTQIDQPLKGDFGWTELKATLDIPRGCANVQVLLMLVGDGEAWFDDVRIELGGEAVLVVPGLFEIRGAFTVASTDPGVTSATLLWPLPSADRDQAPLGYELRVEPVERLRKGGVRVFQDKPGNWVLEATLDNLTTAPDTKVSWSSLVLAAPTDFSALPAAAPMPEAWPEDARPWLRASRSVQSDHPAIRAVAAEIRGESDDVMTILSAVLERASRIYAEQEGQAPSLDAVQALTRKGSCTSRANLVAALLRASDIPARLVAGYPSWSGPLQTHYIVEAYVPGYGWYPIEPTQLRAGWPTYCQIAVSTVYPENEERSAHRRGIAAGVPYLSLTERSPSEAPLITIGTAGKPDEFHDHECRPVKNFAEETPPEVWRELLAKARARWDRRLKAGGTALMASDAEHGVEWWRTAAQAEIERLLLMKD
jgi:transglutaminase-like putative cysteine protease